MSTCRYLVTAAILLAALSAHAQVALVGGDYGTYNRNSLIKKVLLPMDVLYEDFGDTMDFANPDRWRLIIIAHGDEALAAGQEGVGEALEAYVREGGHVLMIGSAPMQLLGTRDMSQQPWIGAEAWIYSSAAPPSTLTEPEHPWLAQLDPEAEYYWLAGTQLLAQPTTAEVLIGTEDAIYLSRNDYGEGWCAFLARGPFPYTRDDVGPMREAHVTMLREIVRDAVSIGDHILTASEIAEMMVSEMRAGEAVLWQRDWEFGSKEGPQFRPQWPDAQELVDVLQVDLALGERESVAVNLTCGDMTRGPVRAEVVGLPEGAPEVEVRVMDRAPLIPWDKPDVEPYESPFWLMPAEDVEPVGSPEFILEPGKTRVLWLQVHAPERCLAQPFSGELRVLRGDELLTSAPIALKVWPVLMPRDRPFKLKAWGFSAPDQRFWDEYGRQSAAAGHLSYPKLAEVMLPEHGISLAEALKAQPSPFADPDNFPRLDFSYLDDFVGGQAAAGLMDISYQDIRTGTQIANAGTGLSLEWRQAAEAPEQWRAIWPGYYRELMRYLRLKGFRRVESIWTDEPSVETIETNYVPIAEMYIEAGMHPGSHWTTPGFMSPDDVNRFAHAVSDWSMYFIMMPKFLSFLREGTVTLRDDAIIGHTRGGYGFAHRFPYSDARRLGWTSWQYDGNFLRTGPVWKGWLYYLNYERFIRDEGVAGERLVAYSTADPNDLSAPLLPSPDWEGARDGADDISLVRMLEMNLAAARESAALPAERLDRIEAEIASMVSDVSPYDLHPEPRHYEHGDLSYDYTVLVDADSGDLARAKRRVLELLMEVPDAPRTANLHEASLRTGDGPSYYYTSAAIAPLVEPLAHDIWWLAGGFAPAHGSQVDDRRLDASGIFLALGDDEVTPKLLASREWFPECRPTDMPGPGDYVLLTSGETDSVLIIGGDEEGVRLGTDVFLNFVTVRGGWKSGRGAPYR